MRKSWESAELTKNLKLCPVCGTAVAKNKPSCRICGWHGLFSFNEEAVAEAVYEMTVRCPEVLFLEDFEAEPTPTHHQLLWQRLKDLVHYLLSRFRPAI